MIQWFLSYSDDAYRLFQEVRQPYAEKNLSHKLFAVGLTYLMGIVAALPLRVVVEVVKRLQVGNPPLQSAEIFRYCFDFFIFLLPLILVGLGIHYRKKW